MLKIDPTDYQLAIAQQEANLRNIEAQLSELGIRALIGGTMASLFTAVIVGMLI